MEKTEDLPTREGTHRDDHELSEELESLYCRVARLDQPDDPAEAREGLDGARQGHRNFTDLPRQTAPPPARLDAQALMEKLQAVQNAYERLLTSWPFAPECSPFPAGKTVAGPAIQEKP